MGFGGSLCDVLIFLCIFVVFSCLRFLRYLLFGIFFPLEIGLIGCFILVLSVGVRSINCFGFEVSRDVMVGSCGFMEWVWRL